MKVHVILSEAVSLDFDSAACYLSRDMVTQVKQVCSLNLVLISCNGLFWRHFLHAVVIIYSPVSRFIVQSSSANKFCSTEPLHKEYFMT